jgi:DnaJ-class molecular chaperone
MSDAPPDYYAILGVSATASGEEIKSAYKRASLASHPDRFPAASPAERARYTARFQSVADAYYVLSDKARRSEYDAVRGTRAWGGAFPGSADWEKAETEQSSSARWFEGFFRGAPGGSSAPASEAGTGQPQGAWC